MEWCTGVVVFFLPASSMAGVKQKLVQLHLHLILPNASRVEGADLQMIQGSQVSREGVTPSSKTSGKAKAHFISGDLGTELTRDKVVTKRAIDVPAKIILDVMLIKLIFQSQPIVPTTLAKTIFGMSALSSTRHKIPKDYNYANCRSWKRPTRISSKK